MSEYKKPLPEFRPETKPYWEATKNHELKLPRSKTNNKFFFYPRAVSPYDDMSQDIEWVNASGRGKVWTYSIHNMGPTKAYKGDPPYVVALVELDEGVKMMTNIVDCDPQDVKIGMEVEVVFDDITEDVTLPKFKPVG
ncbi:MAG: OB-fold domain-containing protein [Candidatus Dadabacteria bacterium]|nr:MAG: OB-fold domain-containing protein [Candidatus Dadabacteria bacterium]